MSFVTLLNDDKISDKALGITWYKEVKIPEQLVENSLSCWNLAISIQKLSIRSSLLNLA